MVMGPMDYTTSPSNNKSALTAAQAYAFLGSSFLRPLSQTEKFGLEPTFWEVFPDFDDPAIGQYRDDCEVWARNHQKESRDEVVRAVSTDYTRLFMGPPYPAAPPWETMNRPDGITIDSGFGDETFEMRSLLRESGLELSNKNRQYEDHIGIELLYLSELFRRFENDSTIGPSIASFIHEHPYRWIGILRERIESTLPDSYYALLAELCEAMLAFHAKQFTV